MRATPFLMALSLLPIALILVMMVGFRWSAARAGGLGWLTTMSLVALFFGAGSDVLIRSQVQGLFLSLHVLSIIWAALILYNVVDQGGAIAAIGRGMAALTGDEVVRLLILSWVFSAFLQGVAGFGVPIAVVAPLLIGLGVEPVTAVIASAVGHSWSVTFGDMASSFQALIVASGLPGSDLAPWSGLALGVVCLACGFFVAYAYRGKRALLGSLGFVLVVGLVMSTVQYLLAVSGLWNLAGFLAGLAGLAIAALIVRLPRFRPAAQGVTQPDGKQPSLILALLPYALLVLLVVTSELWEPMHEFFNQVIIRIPLPETRTALSWVTVAGYTRAISLFGHPGSFLAYASLAGYLLFRQAGFAPPGSWKTILSSTWKRALPASLGILTMVGMATFMENTGMTYQLAQGLSSLAGPLYPLVAPYIGLLGAFMSGSNTNSNVMFAALQRTTAELLRVNALVILAAQTAGGAIGSMLAPAKIVVGCSTAGLTGREGEVLRRTIVYGVLITALVGVVTVLLVAL